MAIGRADGRKEVCEQQSAFEQIDGAVKLEALWREEPATQAGFREARAGKQSLIAKVVEGKEGADSLQAWTLRVERAHVHDAECRLPLMRVQDVGRPARRLVAPCQQFDDGPTEEREPFQVVRIVRSRFLIETLPSKVGIVADRQD